MFDKRERGSYIVKFKKTYDNIEYIKTETTMVNSKHQIINIVIEYDKPIPFKYSFWN